MQRQARQRLQALLLRNEIRYVGRSSWTRAHRRWISKVKLPNPTQQIAFEEYVQASRSASGAWSASSRRSDSAARAMALAPGGEGAAGVARHSALHAVRIVAEFGDLSSASTLRGS